MAVLKPDGPRRPHRWWKDIPAHSWRTDEPLFDDEVVPEPPDDATGVDAAVPRGLRLAVAWSWRLLVILAVAAIVVWIAAYLSAVVMPLMAALLFTAALQPLNGWLVSKRWPPWLAALSCTLFLVVIVGGLLTLVTAQIAYQSGELGKQLVAGFRQLMDWLVAGPLHISSSQINAWMDQLTKVMQEQTSAIAGFLASAGGTIGRFLTGLIMCIFALFFFLKDGRSFAKTAAAWVPKTARPRVIPAARAGWQGMVSYVKAQTIVAACDGLGAGLGALLLGSNLWVAIMALTFVCAFVPMVGALIAGGVGVIVVLATLGWVRALIMLGVFIVVLEGEVHIMQPLLLGRAVHIHPLLVLVSIAVGLVVAGVAGGVFAIPIVALINGVITEMTRPSTGPPEVVAVAAVDGAVT